MKITMNRLLLIFASLIYFFNTSASAFSSTLEKVTYLVEQSTSSPNTLTVTINREQHSETQLVLHGANGIPQQVQNMMCDEKIIKEDKPGVWSIPIDCQKLHWQIPLIESGKELAANQQSMKSGNFMLLSSISSLPRLQDASDEIIKIDIPNISTIFPKPNLTGSIPLPNPTAAPFFILLNPAIVDAVTSDTITLTYFLDNPELIAALPNITSHMNGLRWLNTIIPGKNKEDFSIAWLGISKEKMSLAGAAGDDVLLTNYSNDGELKFGKVMLLYVTLHEAFHQLAMHYPNQPTWVSESLAAYYGARAVQIALPDDPRSTALMERFEADSNHFTDGLLAVNRKVENGDRSEYGAFYTKGLAFWAAVDKALQQTQGHGLDSYLTEIFQTRYDANGQPINLQKILNLSPEVWVTLRSRFLD